MKKIISLIIIFFFTFNFLEAKNKSLVRLSGCNFDKVKINSFENLDQLNILSLEIDISNYRKWSKNNIKIITSGKRFIPSEYKKRFKGHVTITYDNNLTCRYTAKIRQSGDAKDHIELSGNSIIQSLDVDLDEGNIRGITKFKLYKPDVRGNLEDSILQTQLLRNLNYLAPRSIKINARVNETYSVMLFEEKAAKELLEFNNRREGPILEGDQKYFFKLVADIPQNNLSNWSVGTPFLRNKTMQAMLTKSTNSGLILRSNEHKIITLEAINKLNIIYLYWANRFQDEKNNYFFFDYDLDNELLGMFNKKNIIKLDVYNLLMQSTNSQHALGPDARKFYWNSFENYFEPINYDSNVNIDLIKPTTTSMYGLRLPFSPFIEDSFKILEENLKKIDFVTFKKQLELSGLSLTEKQLENKINKILFNLNKFKLDYENIKINKPELIEYNNFKPNTEILNRFKNVLNELDPNVNLITFDNLYSNANKCKTYSDDCIKINLDGNDLVKLAEGDLFDQNSHYQFIGQSVSLKNIKEKEKLNFIEKEDFTLVYEDGIEVIFEDKNKILTINQKIESARALIINGKLIDLNINFNGFNIFEKNNLDLKKFPSKFPINVKNLTGCLSFINTELKNVNIRFTNSSCEDSINFVNSSGLIENLEIENSFSDALDADFSNLIFKNINIKKARNDCADVSSGKYIFDKMMLSECGDKGLSVGEKSFVDATYIEINNANTGIASKDSSQVISNKNNFNNVKTCVSAYKKKQEFEGALLKMLDLKCSNYYRIYELDKFSKIFVENRLIKDFYTENFDLKKDNELVKIKISDELIKKYEGNDINSIIISPQGTKNIFETPSSSKSFKQSFKYGKPQTTAKNPYLYNYGIIPDAIAKFNSGEEASYLNTFILADKPLRKEESIQARVLGSIKVNEMGEENLIIIAGLKGTNFYDFNNLQHLNNANSSIIINIENWLQNYKGQNLIKTNINYSRDNTLDFIKESKKRFKNN